MESAVREPAHVVGHSMGGHIAIHLAALRPDLIRSLTLVNATGVPFRVAPVEHIRNLFLPRGLFGFLTVLAGDAFRAGPTSIALGFGRLIRDDARPLLRALTMPVLLLWGEHDPLVPVIYAKAMLREIPNARLEIVPQASHIPMWENAEAFNHSLLTFLSNISDDERGQARSLFAWPIRGWHEGIAHREAGRWRDVVLLHGLGMSSAYFARFARALFDRGWSPVAPDLRGFGDSARRVGGCDRNSKCSVGGSFDRMQCGCASLDRAAGSRAKSDLHRSALVTALGRAIACRASGRCLPRTAGDLSARCDGILARGTRPMVRHSGPICIGLARAASAECHLHHRAQRSDPRS